MWIDKILVHDKNKHSVLFKTFVENKYCHINQQSSLYALDEFSKCELFFSASTRFAIYCTNSLETNLAK